MSSLAVPSDAKTTQSEVEPVSKVTFSPLNSEAMVVSIRTVPAKPGENKQMETPKRSTSLDSKKRPKTSRSSSEKTKNKSTMTEYRKEISVASQTSSDEPSAPRIGKITSAKIPCVRHAAENISFKAADIPSDKISLCNKCSKSMLSYIFLVQDFLDSLTKEICGSTDTQTCVQCMRDEARQEIIARSEEAATARAQQSSRDPNVRQKIRDSEKYDSVQSNTVSQSDRSRQSRRRSGIPDTAKNQDFRGAETRDAVSTRSHDASRTPVRDDQGQSSSYSENIVPSTPDQQRRSHPVQYHRQEKQNTTSQSTNDPNYQQFSESLLAQTSHPQEPFTSTPQVPVGSPSNQDHVDTPYTSHRQHVPSVQYGDQSQVSHPDGRFIKPMERQQPNFHESNPLPEQIGDNRGDNVQNPVTVTSPFGEETEGIVSSLTNEERQVYESARNGAGYEGMSEVQERSFGLDGRILNEAYVTMCRNNAEALGCLVVGTSLLLTHTARTLCVLVSDGVSMAFREPLASIFHVVQTVRSLDSLGTTKLALLEQPELGISFDKLNVWRLTQFHKCVYLNPDTLVIQNCDELFDCEELSAVPDVGWPDCFNSGVFVFRPSDRTFWQLLEFSDKQGSYDGGDQGLLNSYFSSWSSDISKKLSFIYNLMANVSYTYTPAFKKFGHDVKIVQFHGTFKPWHVKFFNVTGLISPASNVHPTYIDFVNKWIKMFRSNALRQLSQEIQAYASSQELICAVELLRFFPLPTESEAEFFLTPPSVRLRLNEMKLRRQSRPIEEAWRRKSAEFPRPTREEVKTKVVEEQVKTTEVVNPDAVESPAVVEDTAPNPSDDKSETIETKKMDDEVKEAEDDPSRLPGAEVGNYQGMKKWEQGKMDYQGKDSSDSVLKRLDFLMTQPKQ